MKVSRKLAEYLPTTEEVITLQEKIMNVIIENTSDDLKGYFLAICALSQELKELKSCHPDSLERVD